MDEKKLRLLNDFQKLSEGKSSEDMIPLVLAFMEKAKKENITFFSHYYHVPLVKFIKGEYLI